MFHNCYIKNYGTWKCKILQQTSTFSGSWVSQCYEIRDLHGRARCAKITSDEITRPECRNIGSWIVTSLGYVHKIHTNQSSIILRLILVAVNLYLTVNNICCVKLRLNLHSRTSNSAVKYTCKTACGIFDTCKMWTDIKYVLVESFEIFLESIKFYEQVEVLLKFKFLM